MRFLCSMMFKNTHCAKAVPIISHSKHTHTHTNYLLHANLWHRGDRSESRSSPQVNLYAEASGSPPSRATNLPGSLPKQLLRRGELATRQTQLCHPMTHWCSRHHANVLGTQLKCRRGTQLKCRRPIQTAPGNHHGRGAGASSLEAQQHHHGLTS